MKDFTVIARRRGRRLRGSVALLVINTIGPQNASGAVPVDYTINSNDSGVQVLLSLASTANPVASNFGADSGGGAAAGGYTYLGTVALTVGGSNIPLAIPDGLQNVFKLHFLPTGGGDANVVSSASVSIDTTDSVLSPVSFADNSAEGVSWGFTPDEDSAAISGYRVSVWPDGTDPSDALIASGTGATATATGTAAGTIGESGTFASLGAGTYQPTIYYKDPFGNEVFATYADVTVAALVTFAVERVVADYLGNNAVTSTKTFSINLLGYDTGTLIMVPYGNEDFLVGGTLQGNAMTVEQISTGTAGGAKASLLTYVLTAPGTATESLVLNVNTAQQYNVVDVWAVKGGQIVSKNYQEKLDGTSFSVPVTPDNAQNAIFAFVTGRQQPDTAFTWSNLTEIDDERVAAGNNAYMSTGLVENVPSGVAFAVAGFLTGSSFRHSMIAVAITPL